tara:strand:- start:27289 stop:27465 length:177 start_codon:yes stop_codon:yes gene_type:complete
MQYEIWDVISYGQGEPPIPFTLIEKSEDFSEIYSKYRTLSKERPCVIFLNKKRENSEG